MCTYFFFRLLHAPRSLRGSLAAEVECLNGVVALTVVFFPILTVDGLILELRLTIISRNLVPEL